MSEMKPLLISLIAAIPIVIVVWVLVDTYVRFVRSGGEHTASGERMPLLFRFSMPYLKGFSRIIAGHLRARGIASRYEAVLPWEAAKEEKPQGAYLLRWLYNKTRDRLLAAGSPHGFEPEDYWGFTIFCIVLFGLMGALMGLMTGTVYVFLGFAAAGILLPFTYLSDMIRRRQTRVRKELPFALDLLTLSVEAGMDFTAALANIVERLKKSPLAQEFDQAVKEINIGKQRSDALRDMAGRLAMTEVNTVVSSLIQADQLGTGLGTVLRIQAEDVRIRRFQSAEKRASEVPVKMLFPLVAFIFPVTFLMIAAPLLIELVKILLR